MNDRFPFLIAAFVYLMDQYKQLGIVPPEEEDEEEEEKQSEEEMGGNEASETANEKESGASAEAEKKKLTLHRGEAILSLNAVTNFECSLTHLNYSQETSDLLASSLNSVFGRVKASALIIHTSFAQLTTYFVLQEVQNLRSPLDAETEQMLKVLSMALMKTLYLWGVEVECDVEFRRKWAIPSWKR